MLSYRTAFAVVVLTFIPAHDASAASSIPSYVAAAVNDPGRPPADIARDPDRKPAELIAFSGIKTGMHIAEFAPGNGYYTRMLSPLVGSKGRLYAVVPLFGFRDARELREAEKGAPDPIDAALAIQNVQHYANVTVLWENVGQNNGQFPLPEQVDAIWTSNNYHDLHTKGMGAPDVTGVNRAILQTLKTGGIYFVVDHAAAKGAGLSQVETLHRSDAEAVKAEIIAAGFVLDGENSALTRSSDDHMKAATDAAMHDKTDQFVLRFKKPAGALGDIRPKADPLKNYYGNTYIYNMGPGQRHHMYHSDGTYQELAKNDMQSGTWFWDAAGHFCIVHQFPVLQRQYNFCAPDIGAHEIGEKWQATRVGRGTTTQTLLKGYVYP